MSASKISLSLGGSRKAPPPTNGVKRPRAALHEEDDEGADLGESEIVSHFDKSAGGAIDERKKKAETGPLVIAPQANRDWKEKANQRKRQKSGLPQGHGDGNSANLDARMKDVEAKVEASKPGFGLNVYKKDVSEAGLEDTVMANGHDVAVASAEPERTQQLPPQPNGEGESLKQKTDDELAMDALLGKTSKNTTLTIPAADAPMSEEDAFSHDYKSAPAMATLDQYAQMPVEQFGAALLRGMGWKDGEGIGSQKGKKISKDVGKLPERRANLLGIGAKEDAAIAQEMGAWGKAAKGKDLKIYNPVLLRDKKTGQMFTEEELEKKKQEDERKRYENEFDRKEKDRDRKRRDDNDHDSRDRPHRKHDRDSSRDRRKNRDYDRDARRDRDKERRKHDDASDDEYYRRKEKERRRQRERDHDDDRERSHRHRHRDDGGKDKEREKHRDSDRRDRDRDGDRDRRR